MKLELDDNEILELLLDSRQKAKEIEELQKRVEELERGDNFDQKIMDAVSKAVRPIPVPYYYPVPICTTSGLAYINDNASLYNGTITSASTVASVPSVFNSVNTENDTLFGSWTTPETEVMYGIS